MTLHHGHNTKADRSIACALAVIAAVLAVIGAGMLVVGWIR